MKRAPSDKAALKSALKPLAGTPFRKSMGQNVFDHLKRAVVRGELSPGQRLVEIRIAEALEISRTPVREALHKLEREGFLKKLPKGGFTVTGMTRGDIEETFGIRSVLESYAASLAALRHEEEELRPLEEKIAAYQRHLDRGELEALPARNTEFHDLLYDLSRSPRLVRMIHGLRDQIYRFRRIILSRRAMAKTSNDDHRLMLTFIRKRDAVGVERVVREHIMRGRAALLEELDKQTGEDET